MFKQLLDKRFILFFLLGILISLVNFIIWNMQTEIKSYHKGDKAVLLVGMNHFGSTGYYQDLMQHAYILSHTQNKPIDEQNPLVVLDEGVSDKKGLLKDSHISSLQKLFFNSFLCSQPASKKIFKDAVIIRADVDTADFSPETIDFLKKTYNSKTPVDTVMNDLLKKRNGVVFAALIKQLKTSHVVAIPWGQRHLEGISQLLLEAGFKEVSSQTFNPYSAYALFLDALDLNDWKENCSNHANSLIKPILKR